MKSDRGNAKAHDGFTLVEMLVVVSIIGILVAMLLPAVQAAREAGRCMQCNNNLRQIGVACLCHNETRGVLPDGGEDFWLNRTISNGLPAIAGQQTWGWGYQILPYTDQAALWGLNNGPTSTWSITGGTPDAMDSVIYGTPIPLYFCPTRRRPQAINATTVGKGNEIRAMIDYAGNAGIDQTGDDQWAIQGNGRDGVIVRRPDGTTNRSKPISTADIPDGASNTMMIGEKNFNIGRLGYWQPEDDAGFVEGWDMDTIRWGCYPPAPDQDAPLDLYNTSTYRSDALRHSFGSSHPGKFNTVFADGHVRGIGYLIDMQVFEDVCSRYDGQVFNLSDL